MKKKHKFLLDQNQIRIIILILGSVLSTLVLTFSILGLISITQQDTAKASTYLLWIFIVLGLSRFVTWLKKRSKISFIRLVLLLVFDVALGVIIYFGKDVPYLYSLSAGLFCVTVIISRILIILQRRTIRSIILNAIIILLFTFLAIGLFVPVAENEVYSPVIIVCIIVAISALAEVLSNAMSQLKFKVLFKIIFRTYALEVILGLFTMIVACSLIFYFYESSMITFGDALWYSFAVVTTIGFGDFYAVTLMGRIATVLLGIYGIIVVAVITSIIVNFYNETAGKNDSKQLKDINKEEKKD